HSTLHAALPISFAQRRQQTQNLRRPHRNPTRPQMIKKVHKHCFTSTFLRKCALIQLRKAARRQRHRTLSTKHSPKCTPNPSSHHPTNTTSISGSPAPPTHTTPISSTAT